MSEIDILKAQIVRQNASQPWGFKLEGGAGSGEPLRISRVAPGSPAARIGLKAGDEVTEIYNTPTSSLTSQQSFNLLDQYGDSVILTIERKARGSIPVNPVMLTEHDHLKNYQPLDMTGSGRRYRRKQPLNDSLLIESSGLVDPGHPNDIYSSYAAHETHPLKDSQPNRNFNLADDPTYFEKPRRHVNDLDDDDSTAFYPQSRTFRTLQKVMHHEAPSAGEAGLPPPRSAAMEQLKREQRHPSGGRVKVFMPPQYNSPMGMYSADNVLETFTAQAESVLDNIERRQRVQNQPEYGSNGLTQ